MSLNEEIWKKNLLHNIDVLETELDKETIKMNFYIDSYHLYKHLTEQASVMASLNKRFFAEVHKRHIPELPIDRYVYLDLIKKLKNNLKNRLHHELEEYYHKTGVNICNSAHLITLALRFKNEKITDVMKFFDDELAQKKGWEKSHPRLLKQDLYVNFFYGELDQQYLINTLKKRWREEKNTFKKKQFEERYKSFEKKTNSDDEQVSNNYRYKEFKIAIQLFSNLKHDAITEVSIGKVRFDIHDKNNVFVSLTEKAVDTHFTLKAYDDLTTSTQNERFIFITNDGDFAPLLSRVRDKKRRAILAPATHLDNVSQLLKATIPCKKILTLYDVFKTNGLKLLAGEFVQDQYKLSDDDSLGIYSNILGSDFSMEYWDKNYLDYEEEEFNGYEFQPRDQFAHLLSMQLEQLLRAPPEYR